MATIFSRILQGEIPCYKIAEDDRFFAFLDLSPLTRGNTLVIPKTEIDYIFDLEDEQLSGMVLFAKRIAKAIHTEISCVKVGMCVIGLEVPHAHIHLVPMNQIADMNFSNAKLELDPMVMEQTAAAIRARLAV